VRFLSCLRPVVSEPALGRLRSELYSTTTRACFLIITLVPCAWSFVQLASRYLVVKGGRVQPAGVLFLITVLGLEVFMRFWLLAVLQLLLRRVVRPALLWLLLRMTGQQAAPLQQQQQQQQQQQGLVGAGRGAGPPAAPVLTGGTGT
jgi:FlaA1/EpsC-like NDP-sugar epimerase